MSDHYDHGDPIINAINNTIISAHQPKVSVSICKVFVTDGVKWLT